jgi:hypothetical protein
VHCGAQKVVATSTSSVFMQHFSFSLQFSSHFLLMSSCLFAACSTLNLVSFFVCRCLANFFLSGFQSEKVARGVMSIIASNFFMFFVLIIVFSWFFVVLFVLFIFLLYYCFWGFMVPYLFSAAFCFALFCLRIILTLDLADLAGLFGRYTSV